MARRFPTVSAYPDVIDAMMERFPQVLSADVTVTDGIYLGGDQVNQLLQIGVDDPNSADGQVTSADSQITWAGLGDLRRDEILLIRCTASARSGDTEGATKIARDNAFDIVAAVQSELMRGHHGPIIGGAVYAWVATLSPQLTYNSDGVTCDIPFTVQCRVLLQRHQ